MNKTLRTVVLLAVAWLGGGFAQAQTCDPDIARTTPDSDFADAGNGTVRHIPTGLIWKRCAEGQDWNGSTCIGSAAGYTWEQAFARAAAVNAGGAGTWNAGQTDWRMPNHKELRSIAERACTNPSINTTQFPATPAWGFWSGSPVAGDSYYAWNVYFDYGGGLWDYRSVAYHVRLVRAGQYFYNFDAAVTYAVTASAGTGGSASCAPNPAPHAGTSTCTATANAGYTFAAWTGDCAGQGATCTLSNITAAKSSTASFTQNTYAVTASAGTGGTASCAPNPAPHGGSASCTATANPGYTFAAWTGACAGQGASCTLSNITSARNSAASFVTATAAPTLTSGTPPGGTTGTPYSFAVTATGTAPLTFAATGLPPGLAIDPASGVISGIPTTTGSYSVTLSATNAGGTGSTSYSLTIAGAAAATPQPIPTLSEWGMIMLSLLLAGMTALRMRRG